MNTMSFTSTVGNFKISKYIQYINFWDTDVLNYYMFTQVLWDC